MCRLLFYPTPRFRQDNQLHESSRGPLDRLEERLEELGIKLNWYDAVGHLDPAEVKDDLKETVVQSVNKMLSERYGALKVPNGTTEFHIAPQQVMDDLRKHLSRKVETEPAEVDKIPQEGM